MKTKENLINELVELLTDNANNDPRQEIFPQTLRKLVRDSIDMINDKIERNDLTEQDIKNVFECIYMARTSCEHNEVGPNIEIRYEQSEGIVGKITIIRGINAADLFPFDETETGEDIVKDILQCAIDAIRV